MPIIIIVILFILISPIQGYLVVKVKIGKYKNYLGPYQIADKIFFWQKKYPEDESISNRWDYKIKDSFADWLANTKINSLCKLIDKFRKRNIKVRIDYYDTWSMDNTLAYIIAPMLKQLKETKHGSPFIDDEDVPENIRSINAKPKENDYDVDEYHHDRWNYVLNEMIWTFEIYNTDWEMEFYTPQKGEWSIHNTGTIDREEIGRAHV